MDLHCARGACVIYDCAPNPYFEKKKGMDSVDICDLAFQQRWYSHITAEFMEQFNHTWSTVIKS